MANYFYNPCAPCCTGACGWGPNAWESISEGSQFSTATFAGSPSWMINLGTLAMTGGSGSFYKTTAYPNPSNSKLPGWTNGSAQVFTILQSTSGTGSGVFIGNARVFLANWQQNQYVHYACDQYGNPTGAANVISGVTPSPGDNISLCMIPVNPGPNYSAVYSVNASTVLIEESIKLPALQTGNSFNSGLEGFYSAAFGQASLTCGTSCPKINSCGPCPGGVAPCWGLNVTGISASQFNGNFCLRATGCTLADQNAFWTVTVGSGSSTLTAANGSSTFAAYTQSGSFACNGSNAFTLVSATSGTGWPTTITIAPTNCAAPPCTAITTCGQCSWPTQWTCVINGITTAGQCPVNPPFFPPGIPYSVPPDPPWNGDCDPLSPDSTCENVMIVRSAKSNACSR